MADLEDDIHLFGRVLDLPDNARVEFIERICGSDRARAKRLLGLLEGHQRAQADSWRPHPDKTKDSGDPDTIGPYRIVSQIGEGGMGVVYAAEQREPIRRSVAIKLIRLEAGSREVVARFHAERQALALMSHSNIAQILDAGVHDGRPYFVMEHIPGLPITDYCNRRQLPIPDRLKLFIEVCEGVQHAHQKGVIHRDIKPSNILVMENDGRASVKIIDFGIAKAVSGRLFEATVHTEMGRIIGTPDYMSPEQAEVTPLDIDTRADVYSLGALLYELVSGTTVFGLAEARADLEAVRRAIAHREPVRPSSRFAEPNQATDERAAECGSTPEELQRQLKQDLDWITLKALGKDRVRRYPSVSELAADVSRYLAGEPVVARPPSRSYRLSKFVRRHRVPVLAGLAASVLLLASVAATSAGFVWALQEQSRAERELDRASEVKAIIAEMISGVSPSEARGLDTTLLENILDRTASRIQSGEIGDKLIEAELHDLVGDTYQRIGRYDDAERHLPVSYDIRRSELGAEHPDTLMAATHLAILRRSQGRYSEAESLGTEILAIRRETLGDKDPLTLQSMTNLALVLWNQDRLEEAEALLSDSAAASRDVLGREHRTTIATMINLAIVYRHLGRFDEAESLYLEILEVQRNVYGEEHPGTLSILNNLANVYRDQGRLDRASAVLNDLLATQRQVLGDDHPRTLNTMHNLATTYLEQESIQEAELLLRETLDRRRRVLGPEHPRTMSTLGNLGRLYLSTGDLETAVDLLSEAVEVERRTLGLQHTATRRDIDSLATAYERANRPQEAIALHRERLEWKIQGLESQDSSAQDLLAAAQLLLDNSIAELQDPEQARALAERACASAESSGSDDLWRCLDTLALAQHRCGDTAGAVRTQRRAIDVIPVEATEARARCQSNLTTYESALNGSTSSSRGG